MKINFEGAMNLCPLCMKKPTYYYIDRYSGYYGDCAEHTIQCNNCHFQITTMIKKETLYKWNALKRPSTAFEITNICKPETLGETMCIHPQRIEMMLEGIDDNYCFEKNSEREIVKTALTVLHELNTFYTGLYGYIRSEKYESEN